MGKTTSQRIKRFLFTQTAVEEKGERSAKLIHTTRCDQGGFQCISINRQFFSSLAWSGQSIAERERERERESVFVYVWAVCGRTFPVGFPQLCTRLFLFTGRPYVVCFSRFVRSFLRLDYCRSGLKKWSQIRQDRLTQSKAARQVLHIFLFVQTWAKNFNQNRIHFGPKTDENSFFNRSTDKTFRFEITMKTCLEFQAGN